MMVSCRQRWITLKVLPIRWRFRVSVTLLLLAFLCGLFTYSSSNTFVRYVVYENRSDEMLSIAIRPLTTDPRPLQQEKVFMITPTYQRLSQKPNLVSLSQTLKLVKDLHWIVIEDASQDNQSTWLAEMLSRNQHSYTHLACPTDPNNTHARGLTQRNGGLQWIQKENITDGVFYFGDDDNTYDSRLFDEIRSIKTVGIFPTGNMGRYGVSTPVVKDGQIVRWLDLYDVRKFSVDMASIAFNIGFWLKKGAPKMVYRGGGQMETSFIERLGISKKDLELKADNCTKILVWHTQTKKVEASLSQINKTVPNNTDTNLPIIVQEINFRS